MYAHYTPKTKHTGSLSIHKPQDPARPPPKPMFCLPLSWPQPKKHLPGEGGRNPGTSPSRPASGHAPTATPSPRPAHVAAARQFALWVCGASRSVRVRIATLRAKFSSSSCRARPGVTLQQKESGESLETEPGVSTVRNPQTRKHSQCHQRSMHIPDKAARGWQGMLMSAELDVFVVDTSAGSRPLESV